MYFKIGYLLGLNRVFEAFERCLNTQASQQPPSLTAGGHSVESAKKKKENLLSRYRRANRVNTQASQQLPSHTAGGHSVEAAEKKKENLLSRSLQKS